MLLCSWQRPAFCVGNSVDEGQKRICTSGCRRQFRRVYTAYRSSSRVPFAERAGRALWKENNFSISMGADVVHLQENARPCNRVSNMAHIGQQLWYCDRHFFFLSFLISAKSYESDWQETAEIAWPWFRFGAVQFWCCTVLVLYSFGAVQFWCCTAKWQWVFAFAYVFWSMEGANLQKFVILQTSKKTAIYENRSLVKICGFSVSTNRDVLGVCMLITFNSLLFHGSLDFQWVKGRTCCRSHVAHFFFCSVIFPTR